MTSHRRNKKSEDIFNIHHSMRFSLKLLEIFGFFPLHGISSPDHTALKFAWLSFKFFYSLLHFLLSFFFLLLVVYNGLITDISIPEITNVVFYSSGLISNILLLKLAKEWPQLMTEWHQLGSMMGPVGITKIQNLPRRLKVLTITFLSVALVEHVLVQCYFALQISNKCNTMRPSIKHFYSSYYYYVFNVVEYSLWKAVVVQIITTRSTFSWTYVDVLIILISTVLALRLRQLVIKVEMHVNSKVRNPKYWKQLREEHHQLFKLCGLINNKLSYLVLVSFGTNLYFILVQLFGSMRLLINPLRKTYYVISFGLLVLRLGSVCLFAASVNEESKKILPLLFRVPSSIYNAEIRRFIDQTIKNEIVLSGKNFFVITRGLMLQISGAVVTYELVLIQFNSQLFYNDDNNVFSCVQQT